MGIQAVAVVEEAVRGTFPGSPVYNWLPVTGQLFPDFAPEDESRNEFRGQDSAEGDSEDSLVRRGSQVLYGLECAYYPGAATGLLFKHLLGKAGTRVAEDTDAFKGPLYFEAEPYGTDNELSTKALSIVILYDKEGTTYKRVYPGFRPNDCNMTGADTDDIKMTFNMKTAGDWIGDEEVNDLTPDYTGLTSPFTTSDLLCYIGSGASLTGTTPDFTDVSPGTMDSFCPDSWDVTITSGRDDKVQMCGTEGPSKTFRAAQFSGTIGLPIDLEDPSSGFSSWDESDKQFTAPSVNSLMFVMDNGELAGATTATYESTFYFPAGLLNSDTPQIPPDGTQKTVTLNYTTKVDNVVEKAMILQTIDKAADY